MYLLRKYTHFDIVLSMIKSHQPPSSQIVEQIEVIQVVVSSGMSNMNDSAPDKRPKEQTQFSPKETLVKGK